MCESVTLPPDLSDAEAATVSALVDRAASQARERAALAVRVRRAVREYRRQGRTVEAALGLVAGDLPVSYSTAANIWYRRRAYAV